VPKFDLVICDEAHRTTGMVLPDEDESHFVRVHDAEYIKAKKRLYMTATPRIYSDASQSQAKENDIELCSMDDEALYGKEFHRLGFAEAVTKGLLSDYKVLVLAVDEKFVSKTFQRQLADSNNELTLDDAVKIVGCWNGLSKHSSQSEVFEGIGTDTAPMRRAVAFSRSIKDSKTIVSLFSQIVQQYRSSVEEDESMLDCEVRHVDGTFNVLLRNNLLDWLKADTSGQGNVCRILSNARCLSEGVDVPALDAVMFLNPRDSVVDVVQSVGRVMRKVEGKQYGYIILPVGIPADTTPEKALEDNKRYKVVWQVLQALRAHDDRFNAMINKLDLNKAASDNLQIIGVGGGEDKDRNAGTVTAQIRLSFPEIEEWREAIYAKIVLKCGDRRYWETWAADIAVIAQRHIERITLLLAEAGTRPRKAFDAFLAGLHENLNPSVTEGEAIEMLAQHLITKPVFDALFEGYQFTQENPVSVSMQKILGILEGQALEKETATLEKFYASVRERASGIDNAEGKQKIIVELYDKFFRVAFKGMVERLGIVYTPIEVVDFIIRSVDEALREEFGASLSDRDVHVLDPFTGTGTFMVRLLQSGLIKSKDLLFKYRNELHANEIVLLAYYLAAINIEETFHGLIGGEFVPFEGVVLTDTFQMAESEGMHEDLIFSENNQRARKQKKQPIRVILGNPPYSVGQESVNDANQNLKYPKLDDAIRNTYARYSNATNKNSLYNSYIRAFRWSSDRIKEKGILCFVSSSFVDANSADGLRKCVVNEFTSIYSFNLRGNQRTSGELSRKEGGKIFGSGSRSPIAITLMVKNPAKSGQCKVHYYDIGDYLSREEKLRIISDFGTFGRVPLRIVEPNPEGDWINPRDVEFGRFVSIDGEPDSIFSFRSNGVQTNRDDWAYNLNKDELARNMKRMIAFYNQQVSLHGAACKAAGKDAENEANKRIDRNSKKIKWTGSLVADLCRERSGKFDESRIGVGMYRPFCKSWVYYDQQFNHRFKEKLYPTVHHCNFSIQVTGPGASNAFSCLAVNVLPDVQGFSNGQCFPLHYFEKACTEGIQVEMFGSVDVGDGFVFKECVTDVSQSRFRQHYCASEITKEDIFYYVYGILHSPEYRARFANDLKKMLPRIPFVEDFWAFSEAGRNLAKWHLEYESVEPYPLAETISGPRLAAAERFRVAKMGFGKKDGRPDKSVILYNSHVTLSGIPLEAYDYVVNGKPALEWIMERYQVTKDKDSGIVNDPNEWSKDPRYIVDLVKRLVRVSLETVKIVNSLPALQEDRTKAGG